jgi:hypothetical protein
MKKTTIILISLFTLMGCRSLSGPIAEEEFLKDSSIEYVLHDADITDLEAFYTTYISNNVTSFDLIEVYLSSIDAIISEYDYIQMADSIDVSLFNINENSRFFLMPVFNTWFFDDVELQYSYMDGSLVFSISPSISNFPTTTLKYILIHINSPHVYQATLA